MSSPWENLIAQAWEKRLSFMGAEELSGTNTFRLFCGENEGIPGFTVDRFDCVGIFQVYEGQCPLATEEIRRLATWYLENTPLRSLYAKNFVADRSRTVASQPMYCASPLAGEEVPPEVLPKETGLTFAIRPYAGFSVGLFLDQREHRRFLAQRGQGKRVLNGFAYTCAFSVACAAQGARVTSVDLSRKFLEWGKRNFELNQLSPAEHLFFEADIFDFYRRAERRKEEFDLIVLDPPSFSRNARGQVFNVSKDFNRLWLGARKILSPGGELFFSSNYSGWSKQKLIKLVLEVDPSVRCQELPSIPQDFMAQTHSLSRVFVKV